MKTELIFFKLLVGIILLAGIVSCQQKETGVLPAWALGPFIRPEGSNPVICPQPATRFFCPMTGDSVAWEESDTFNPAAVMKDGKICVLYRAEDNSGTGIGLRTSRIGLAESTDGIHMTRYKYPVLYPDKDDFCELDWPGGCEDSRVVVTEDGLYVMLYTSWNRKIPRLSVATSRDLLKWEKHGYAFQDTYNGIFNDMACKSGSVITEIKDGKLVVTKINGKYWMLWGEHAVCAATSDDLIHWLPVVDENNELKTIVTPREKYFDSELTECGPPAILTEDGILLIYNGKNKKGEGRAPDFAAGSYCAGQLLLDRNDPFKVLGRLDKPFFRPEVDFEKSGQYVDGTVFTEGLVYYQDKWYLYYGCADSYVAVAVCDKKL